MHVLVRALLIVAVTCASLAVMLAPAPGQASSHDRYTSPQFGYVVTWEAPWSLVHVESESGQFDYLSVSTGDVYQEFIGIFTDATSEDAMRAVLYSFAETRREQYPDLVIEQEWYPPADAPRMFMVLLFTDAATSIVWKEVVDLVLVVPGESAYIWVWGAIEQVTTCSLAPWVEDCEAVMEALPASQVKVFMDGEAMAAAEDLLSQLEARPFPNEELPSGFVNAVVSRNGDSDPWVGRVGSVSFSPRRVYPQLQSSSQGITYRVYTTAEEAMWAYLGHASWLVREEGMVETELAGLSYPAVLLSKEHVQLGGAGSICLVLVGNVVVIGSFTSLDFSATLLLAEASAFNLAMAGLAHLERITAESS